MDKTKTLMFVYGVINVITSVFTMLVIGLFVQMAKMIKAKQTLFYLL